MMPLKFIVLLLLPLIPARSDTPTESKVRLRNGEVHGGSTISSRDGKPYHFFKGIPYGKVEKRFGIARHADRWFTPLQAIDSGPGCITSGMMGPITGIEDCLTLDVYTTKLPSTNDKTLFPVMVWIHGGGFVEGASSEYGPSYFMESDTSVVLVVINYRLGPLGFLNVGTSSASGNQGLKDQVLSLRWVQDNIAHFSGDKNRVTIFGESSGSISVSYLTLSPMAEGLFHRAIMQSGTAIQPFNYHGMDGPTLAKRLGRELDCPTSHAEYLVECLQRIDPKLFGPWMKLVNEFGFDESAMFMGPSIETFKDGDVFIGEDPFELVASGRFHKVPIIMGLIGWENYGSALIVTSDTQLTHQLKSQWGRIAPNMLFLTHSAEDPSQTVNAIKDRFLPENNIDLTSFENMISERHWTYPFRTMAALYGRHVPVYVYNWTQQVPILTDPVLSQFMPKFEDGNTRRVPSHADELPYLFEWTGPMGQFYEPIDKGSDDYEFSKQLVSTWTSFAKTGKPDGPWESWLTFEDEHDTGDQNVMHLQDPPVLRPAPKVWKDNDKFWKDQNIKEYGNSWSDAKMTDKCRE